MRSLMVRVANALGYGRVDGWRALASANGNRILELVDERERITRRARKCCDSIQRYRRFIIEGNLHMTMGPGWRLWVQMNSDGDELIEVLSVVEPKP